MGVANCIHIYNFYWSVLLYTYVLARNYIPVGGHRTLIVTYAMFMIFMYHVIFNIIHKGLKCKIKYKIPVFTMSSGHLITVKS